MIGTGNNVAVEIATTLESATAAALTGMMPDINNPRLIGKTVWDTDYNGEVRYFVTGILPNGQQYEVPLTLDVKAIYRNEQGAWLNSIELARELQKAARAFAVAVALSGKSENTYSAPALFQPFVIGRHPHNVIVAAMVPGESCELISGFIEMNNPGTRMFHRIDLDPYARGPGNKLFHTTYNIDGLLSKTRYVLTTLESTNIDGVRMQTHCNEPFQTS